MHVYVAFGCAYMLCFEIIYYLYFKELIGAEITNI